jgi:hypothetical protein
MNAKLAYVIVAASLAGAKAVETLCADRLANPDVPLEQFVRD